MISSLPTHWPRAILVHDGPCAGQVVTVHRARGNNTSDGLLQHVFLLQPLKMALPDPSGHGYRVLDVAVQPTLDALTYVGYRLVQPGKALPSGELACEPMYVHEPDSHLTYDPKGTRG